jgi:hypothetical protein
LNILAGELEVSSYRKCAGASFSMDNSAGDFIGTTNVFGKHRGSKLPVQNKRQK